MNNHTTDNVVHIAAITDANYAVITAVMLTSLKLSKHPDSRYCIHLFQTEECHDFESRIRELESPDFIIKTYFADLSRSESIRVKTHVSKAALIKFELSTLLPQLDKVLYIDGDCIITKDLSALFQTEMGSNLIAACTDLGPIEKHAQSVMGNEPYTYINSGVILMNTALMREEHIAERFWDVKLHAPKEWVFMDQDAINLTCKGRILYLPIRYNYLIFVCRWNHDIAYMNRFLKTQYADWFQLENDVTIFHFASIGKPWQYVNVTASDLWMHYYLRSPYGRVPLKREVFVDEVKKERELKQLVQNEATAIAQNVAAQISRQTFDAKEAELSSSRGVVKLFGLLPFFCYRRRPDYYQIRLFNFIPLLKIRRKNQRAVYYLFELLPVLTHMFRKC